MDFEIILENMWLGVIWLVILFGVLYIVAFLSLRQTASSDDLYAASFSIGPLVNGLAMVATWASLATFMGISGLVLELKSPFIFLWTQLTLSIPLMTLLYGSYLRRIHTYTPASFVRRRYGSEATVVAVTWMVLSMLMYALGQMVGLGYVFQLMFDIPYITSVAVAGVLTVTFVTLGGMYGASFNQAFMCALMIIAMIVPIGAIMEFLGSSGWWFPNLGYGDLVPTMMDVSPTFFNIEQEFMGEGNRIRWYFALIPAFSIGSIALPHLAMRVFTSRSRAHARAATIWFVFFVGLLFTGVYAAAFTGVYFEATEGIQIPDPDQIILVLSLFYNPEWVAAFVMAGAVAGGLSTIAGNLLAISALVGNDLMNIIAPNAQDRKKVRMGYLAMIVGGIAMILLALSPPRFLVVSILWAFGMLATTITPSLLLGVWWKKTHKYAVIVSSLLCGFIYIIISPHVLAGIVIGFGTTADLGMSGGLVTVPFSFALTILLSFLFKHILPDSAPSLEDKMLVDYIHGWGEDYDERRYNWTTFPVIIAVLCLLITAWGLQPW